MNRREIWIGAGKLVTVFALTVIFALLLDRLAVHIRSLIDAGFTYSMPAMSIVAPAILVAASMAGSIAASQLCVKAIPGAITVAACIIGCVLLIGLYTPLAIAEIQETRHLSDRVTAVNQIVWNLRHRENHTRGGTSPPGPTPRTVPLFRERHQAVSKSDRESPCNRPAMRADP
jgi:uncharacterized membrane protein YhaH (DUF805 family)